MKMQYMVKLEGGTVEGNSTINYKIGIVKDLRPTNSTVGRKGAHPISE